MNSSKKRLVLALSLCSILILVYIVLYAGQGKATAHLTKIGIDRDETIRLYNSEHIDNKLADNFYTDEDIFLDTQINKYVYHFTLSANSKIFRKNYIYNIYPEFNTLKMPVEYAYMQIHGDKYGSLVLKEKLKLDSIDPISINLVMNDKIFYLLIFCIFAIFFICCVIPFVFHKLQSQLQSHVYKNTEQSSIVIAPPPPQKLLFIPFYIIYLFVGTIPCISIQYGVVRRG